jgi:hypothetical protein
MLAKPVSAAKAISWRAGRQLLGNKRAFIPTSTARRTGITALPLPQQIIQRFDLHWIANSRGVREHKAESTTTSLSE